MSDFKSKLPDFKELTSMTSKLFNGLKNSLEEIVKDYKDKRTTSHKKTATKTSTKETKTESVKRKPVKKAEKKAEKKD